MEKTAGQIQKERIGEIEAAADFLIKQSGTVTLASVNEAGYPRICTISKVGDNGFRKIWFFTSKRSAVNGKAVHFENNPKASVCCSLGGDSVTLIGEIEIVHDLEEKKRFDAVCDRRFFKKGVEDPRCVLLRFRTLEATFWIGGRFRTCRYKKSGLAKQ